MSDELLDIKQVQDKLKVSERTVFNLIKRGELTGFKVGREWRFQPSDIDAYIQRQRKKASGEKSEQSNGDNKPERPAA